MFAFKKEKATPRSAYLMPRFQKAMIFFASNQTVEAKQKNHDS